MKHSIAVGVIGLLLFVGAARARAADVFYFTSARGSWIGQGQTLTFTPPETPLYARRTGSLGAYTNSVELGAGGYSFTLVEPNYSVPEVGFFDNVTRWPFMDSGAGMAFTGPGRANNQLSGWFNVLEAEYNPDGSVRSFAVDFRQYDENSAGAWNQGSIRYNSTVPVPEPTAAAAGLLIAAMLLRRHRRLANAAQI
jgi:hypothetical protein